LRRKSVNVRRSGRGRFAENIKLSSENVAHQRNCKICCRRKSALTGGFTRSKSVWMWKIGGRRWRGIGDRRSVGGVLCSSDNMEVALRERARVRVPAYRRRRGGISRARPKSRPAIGRRSSVTSLAANRGRRHGRLSRRPTGDNLRWPFGQHVIISYRRAATRPQTGPKTRTAVRVRQRLPPARRPPSTVTWVRRTRLYYYCTLIRTVFLRQIITFYY